ncbi:MAG: tetratricopeptide repeat protein [Bacteroidia bacterium]|nr:tetratricopeptide repeat protein [Bacteroidia bacterium]
MKKSILALLFTVFIGYAHAQDDKVKTAFATSLGYENKTNYSLAISKLMEIYSPTSYEINLRLGWLHYCAGTQVDSKKYYKIAMELMPFSVEAKFGYIYPASILGEWDDVANQYNAILKIDPNNSYALYALGMVYYNGKLYEKAYKCFSLLVNLYPFTYDGLHMLAWTNYRLSKPKEAKQLFNRVLLLAPNDASSLEGLALIK